VLGQLEDANEADDAEEGERRARLAGSLTLNRLLYGQQRRVAGECGQCHVVGVRSKLNTDLFAPKQRYLYSTSVRDAESDALDCAGA